MQSAPLPTSKRVRVRYCTSPTVLRVYLKSKFVSSVQSGTGQESEQNRRAQHNTAQHRKEKKKKSKEKKEKRRRRRREEKRRGLCRSQSYFISLSLPFSLSLAFPPSLPPSLQCGLHISTDLRRLASANQRLSPSPSPSLSHPTQNSSIATNFPPPASLAGLRSMRSDIVVSSSSSSSHHVGLTSSSRTSSS